MSALVKDALTFATAAHAGVSRRWTGEPYITHPERVAAMLEPLGFGPEVIAAALLHDVVEDTDATVATLAARFGPMVAALVSEVTKPVAPGNRAARKAAYKAHLAGSSYAGASIKLADMLDNSSNVASHDAKFAALYFVEMRDNMTVLGHGHPALVAAMTARLAG